MSSPTAPSSTPPSRARSSTITAIQNANAAVKNAATRALDADVPLGMWAATASATSSAPTLVDIRRGAYDTVGWDATVQKEQADEESLRRTSSAGSATQAQARPRAASGVMGRILRGSITEGRPRLSGSMDQSRSAKHDQAALAQEKRSNDAVMDSKPSLDDLNDTDNDLAVKPQAEPLPLERRHTIDNGYRAPPKVPWKTSLVIGTKAFWKWFLTPFGFLVTIYGLNVVAWGAMLFFLLLSVAPAMCSQNVPSNHFNGCNDIDSPRRIWIEYDSQILTALFCVTAFGLIPWRFRDLYYLLRWRFARPSKVGKAGKLRWLRILAGINAGWYRLPGSDTLDEMSESGYCASIGYDAPLAPETAPQVEMTNNQLESQLGSQSDPRLPIPLAKAPSCPPSGVRAEPSHLWLLDAVIWLNCFNTFFQVVLCGFMWGMNRYRRPSWSTGLFVCLGCVSAGVAGIIMFVEGKKVKKVEGVAPPPEFGRGAAAPEPQETARREETSLANDDKVS